MKSFSQLRYALGRRISALRNRGSAVECPNCGRSWSRFKPAWNREGAICWRCGSHERHRAQWLLLSRQPQLLDSATELLHFAPEYCLEVNLRAAQRSRGQKYTTADINPAGVDLQLDLMSLELDSDSFDAVICSHVLEHVLDDQLAMSELHRVIRPGGWCLVSVPLDPSREETYEDAGVTSPADRERQFLQSDHLRLYAPDIEQRLSATGFEVDVIKPSEFFEAEEITRYGLLKNSWIFLCRA